MKVTGPRSSSSASPTRRARGPASGSSFTPETEGVEERRAPGVGGAAGVDSVAALLALQAEGGATDGRSRGVARAEGLLDRLDQLKLALLEGRPLATRLKDLAAATAEAREETGDPRLDSILNEVEVRAAVELAKNAAA
jgi:hypothetical protein